jgi:transcriptional regulator with XRE-family HTH domain
MLDFSLLPGLYKAKYRTQSGFAASIGLTQSHVSQIMLRKKRVTTELLETMAIALEMSVTELTRSLEKNIAKSA